VEKKKRWLFVGLCVVVFAAALIAVGMGDTVLTVGVKLAKKYLSNVAAHIALLVFGVVFGVGATRAKKADGGPRDEQREPPKTDPTAPKEVSPLPKKEWSDATVAKLVVMVVSLLAVGAVILLLVSKILCNFCATRP
jgi:hypothetical protein